MGITVTHCGAAEGDSTQKPNGATEFTRSHLVGSPVYKVMHTRQLSDGSLARMDYMVHEPAGTPKGVFVLITGGGLNALLEGQENTAPTFSGSNFLIRCAHLYQAQGYRAITINCPSDAERINNKVLVDYYRNSMKHAVDLVALLQRENSTHLPVILSGTSRGAISAVANNTLAAGIAISSPITRAFRGGMPVGSSALPVTCIKRPVHLLFHADDRCRVSPPAKSRELYARMQAAGIDVSCDEVSGGFRDTAYNDVCAEFDFHGFNGIETCAVRTETDWADSLTARLAGVPVPAAHNLSVVQAQTIELQQNTGDALHYAVPHATSALGGRLVAEQHGRIVYKPPVGLAGLTDSFAYTVTSAQGGVSAALVQIRLD